MVVPASPLAVVVLADIALLQVWTVALFWKHAGDVDWTFLRAPLDTRYGGVAVVFASYVLAAVLAHGAMWLAVETGEFAFVHVIAPAAFVAVGLYFPIGTSNLYVDHEELRERPGTNASAPAERFAQDWIRGIGWTFLTVATTSIVVPWSMAPSSGDSRGSA